MDLFETFFSVDNTYEHLGIIVYNFDDSKKDEFIENFVIPFRQAYYSDEDLNYEVDSGINTREIAIENKLPTLSYLKSGEFSEILMFYIASLIICADANVTPIKWRWKDNRDTPCHLADIVLLKCLDKDNPSNEDYFFSMEVKSAATKIGKRSTYSRFNEAIEGAINDKNSRIAKMIAYLTTKYAREREADKALIVKRFEDCTTVAYKKIISAAVVSERDSLQYHVSNISSVNATNVRNDKILLFAVPIANLKILYEELYHLTPIKG